jgi:hypothetical protein
VALVNRFRNSAPGLRHFRVAIAFLLLALSSSPLLAQTASLPDRLPADTVFFAHWRGMSSVTSAEKTNHLVQLLEDPQFTLGRDALLRNLRSNMAKNGAANTEPELTEVLSILDNSAVVGFVLNPAAPTANDKPASDAPVPPVGFFLVYDATGKTALVKKLRAEVRANGKEVPTVMTYDFKGTTVEARTTGTDVSYTALTPKYYFLSDQKSVIEDLITRFSLNARPVTAVTQIPEYQAIRSFVAPNAVIDFFARVPDLAKTLSPDQLDKPGVKFAENLHLDRIHVFGGSVSFEGAATRIRGAVLGDASAGTLFDVAGASSAAFATLPVVSPGPMFSISRFNLAATYQLLRAAAMPGLAPQQTANIEMYEKVAQGFLGMSLPDALRLSTGEIAYQSYFADDGSTLKTYAVAIQKPQDVLHIFRAAGGAIITGEETAGDTTYLDLAYPSTDPATGQKRSDPYYVAVAPTMLFAAPTKAAVREATSRLNAKAEANSATGVLANSDYSHMRSLLPEKLSGLSAFDLAHIPWDKILARYAKQAAEDAAKNPGAANPSATDWLKSVKPEVVTRHLNFGISGWWKDSSGIYFDSYVQ